MIHPFLRYCRGANSTIGDWILTKFKLIQAFIVVLIICKNEKIHSKLKAREWSQHFSHYKSMGNFQMLKGS